MTPLVRASRVSGGFAQAGLELFPLLEEVPVEMAANAAGGVGEAVFFLQLESAAGEGADDGAAAFGAEVKGEELRAGHAMGSVMKAWS
jgi:hypothetical protein